VGALAPAARLARALRVVSGLVMATVVIAMAFRPAFDGYDTDLWSYLLIVERVADGQDVLHLDHFRLEPPASPHVSLVWLGLGLLRRVTGWPPLPMVRLLGALSAALLAFAVWRLAGRLAGPGARWPALVFFWLAMPESWGAVVLGRYLSFAFVLLAAEASVGRSRLWPAGVFIALAFYTHLFGGLLALAAVGLLWAAQRGRDDAPSVADLAGSFGLGLTLASPCLAYSFATLGLRRGTAHLWRPEQVELGPFRMLSPLSLPDLVPWPVLVFALLGLIAPAAGAWRLAQRLARLGTAAAALALFTPLYQAAASVLGAWLMARVGLLAFPWLSAALGLLWLVAPGRGLAARRVAAAVLAVAAAAHAFAREAAEWADRRYVFAPAAQEEARGMRELLHGRSFLSLDVLGYALATPTLGRPLAVPPGQASPFGDFQKRQRRAHRALSTNTPECWTALLQLYPDLDYLVTPGPEARVERALWRERLGGTTPEAVRDTLLDLRVLTPLENGRFFRVDALHPPPADAAARVGMGQGARCE
jgi:hypothetical protein